MRQAGIFAVAALAGIVASAAPAFAEYGAFAYEEATGKYGFSWNETDQHRADAAALKGCAAEGCKVVFRVGPKRCGAIAITEDGNVWGGAWRDTRDGAKLAALEDCQKRTKGQCIIRGNECNR